MSITVFGNARSCASPRKVRSRSPQEIRDQLGLLPYTEVTFEVVDGEARLRKADSDGGCQYTSTVYRDRLAALAITVSMSRKGNCWDNAVAESFFETLKNELVYRRPWRTRDDLRAALFEYIEVFYNRRRLHSSLDYRTPAEVERLHLAAAA